LYHFFGLIIFFITKARKDENTKQAIFLVHVCPGCGLSFNEFDFLRIHKLLVNINIDELVKSQIYDNIYRAKLINCP